MDQLAHLISDKNDPEQIFELLDILGQGSYGSVSKALHKETGQLYAIKILPTTSGVEIASIKKQIGILKQCNDDHIVKYYGSYFKDNNLWIVMEYCIAGSVADIMQITKKKFNQNQIASILESVLRGLDYLHARKKIHRDVKAANILLDQKGNAKLADFGVSASAMHTNARFRTHIGSPYWMSPEIIKFSQYNYKTDIWSLGVTAIQLAQGQVPNSHIKPFMAIFMIKSNPIQSFKEPKLWSKQFNSFIRQCLSINPNQRPQASQLLQHEFIRKFSKGQRLLSQLVLSSIQQIEEFRMNQSRNSSFAEIIIDEGRQLSQGGKTLVEGNSVIKLQGNDEDVEYEGSMIIMKSERSDSCAGSVIINDNSMIEYRETQNSSKDIDPLTSYINGLKQETNVEAKCIQKLVVALNKYDEELVNQLQKKFEEYKDKVTCNIEGLQGLLKNNQKTNKSQTFICQIAQSKDLYQFLKKKRKISFTRQDKIEQKQEKQGKTSYLNIVKQADGLVEQNKPVNFTKSYDSEDHTPNCKILQAKNIESTKIKSRNEEFKKIHDDLRQKSENREREQIKSFIIPNSQSISSDTYLFKKNSLNQCYMVDSNTNSMENDINSKFRSINDPPQAAFQKPLVNAHNSSRIMIKRTDQYNVATESQVRQFANDPEVLQYLRQKNYLNNQLSYLGHTKSSLTQQATTSSCMNSKMFFRQQKSIQKQREKQRWILEREKSKSRSKTKGVKNNKSKKLKGKVTN